MIFQQILNEESGCLSYLIGCSEAGRALIVDPGRDRVHEYLRLAAKKGLSISHIVETHTHADHISGNRDLAEAARAPILVHRAAGVAFAHEAVSDGDEIRIGNVRLTVAHTPGHTPDSICLLVADCSRGEAPWFVLTGDTLFVGSVGRPDLGGARAAEDAWESLQRVLIPLDDCVEVYPAHGAGSMCGRAMSSKTGSTIGFERRFNPALRARDEEEFVRNLLADLLPTPPNFKAIIERNRSVAVLTRPAPQALPPRGVRELIDEGAVVLDVRTSAEYGEGHVPGAVNVSIESPQFVERCGWFIPQDAVIVLVAASPTDPGRAVTGLSRVGLDGVTGYLQRGMTDWRGEGMPTEQLAQISVHDLATWREEQPDLVVVDVREPFEWDEGHIAGALHLPMREAVARLAELPVGRPKAVLCAAGSRSSTVISALKRSGARGPWYNVSGGMTAWLKAGYAVVR